MLANHHENVIDRSIQYSLCDITLLSQIYYYRWKSQQGTESLSDLTETVDETTPLLPSDNEVQRDSTISTRWIIIRYLLSLFFVFGVGTAAWAISEHMNLDAGTSSPPTGRRAWIVQTLGWTSALLYVRINIQTKLDLMTLKSLSLAWRTITSNMLVIGHFDLQSNFQID